MRELTREERVVLHGIVAVGGMMSAPHNSDMYKTCEELNKLGLLITDAAVLIGRPRTYFITVDGSDYAKQDNCPRAWSSVVT